MTKTMQYKVIDLYAATIARPEEWEEHLNEQARDGWRVVAAVPGQGKTRVILERDPGRD